MFCAAYRPAIGPLFFSFSVSHRLPACHWVTLFISMYCAAYRPAIGLFFFFFLCIGPLNDTALACCFYFFVLRGLAACHRRTFFVLCIAPLYGMPWSYYFLFCVLRRQPACYWPTLFLLCLLRRLMTWRWPAFFFFFFARSRGLP